MKKYILLCPFLLILIFSGCGIQPAVPSASASPSPVPTPAATASPPEATATDYFPIRENVRYIYAGAGSEYASFDVYADYASDTRVQQRINNGGTVVARVVEVTNDRVTRVYNREESYHRENALDRTNDSEILLMTPIETGTSWTLDDGRVRTITGVSVSVETPSGSYSAVAVETSGDGSKTTDYYAKGTGLVKTVSEGEGYEVSSVLAEIQEVAPS